MANGNMSNGELGTTATGKPAIGYVKFSQGVVLAINELGHVRELLPGDTIYQGETILTGDNGFAILSGFSSAILFIPEDSNVELAQQSFHDIPTTQLMLSENLGINNFLAKLFQGTLSESLETPELALPESFQSEPLLVTLNTSGENILSNLTLDAAEPFIQVDVSLQNVKDNLEKLGVSLENFANLENNLLDVADLSGIETPPLADPSSDGSTDSSSSTSSSSNSNADPNSNVIFGGAGDDVLVGSSGADVFNGGSGNDTVSYANASSGVYVSLTQQVQPSLFFSTTDDTVLGGVPTSDEHIVEATNGSLSLFFDDPTNELLNPGENIDGVFIRDNGNILLSTTNGGSVNGDTLTFQSNDIVEFDGTSFSIAFDGDTIGIPGGTNINALHLLENGNLIFSMASDGVNLPGLTNVNAEDLVLYNGVSFSLFFDGSTSSPDLINEDINGVAVRSNGDIIFTLASDAVIDGNTFSSEDLIQFDGDTFSLFVDGGSIDANLETNTIDALHIFEQGDAQGDTFISIENLLGSMFDDNLIGDDNDNILTTGGGTDFITSGAGNDVFRSSANDTGADIDTYVDFDADNDTLDISQLLDNYDPASDDIAAFITIAANGDVNVDADGQGAGGAETIANIATTPGSGTTVNVIGQEGTTEQVTVA